MNQFHGEGEMIYFNKDIYKGTWLNGKKHGHGMLFK